MQKLNPNHAPTPRISPADSAEAIAHHRAIFTAQVVKATTTLATGAFEETVAYAQIAAEYAWRSHTGIFASSELEKILLTIGTIRAAASPVTRRNTATAPTKPHVLHILSQSYDTGGHTRLAWRWISHDTQHFHSVALTRQAEIPVPSLLRDAVAAQNGQIYTLDTQRGGLLARAAGLRACAASADIIVLHTHPSDVVPLIAFADKQNWPPIILVNHADHVFWLGVSIADVVAHIRQSGVDVSIHRRGVEPLRCIILPIPLTLEKRQMSRTEAKTQLGLSPDSAVLLTLGAYYKYTPIDGHSFVDMVIPTLKRFPSAILLAVGPTAEGQWLLSDPLVQDRVIAFGRRKDAHLFYQAADIYLDSFPFASLTALLEAGSYGTPIVDYSQYTGDSLVLGADDPALEECLIRATTLSDFDTVLTTLITDSEARLELGTRTQAQIRSFHSDNYWFEKLTQVYNCAKEHRKFAADTTFVAPILVDTLDVRLNLLNMTANTAYATDVIVRGNMRLFPLPTRIVTWAKMFRPTYVPPLGLLLPEWLGVRFEKWRLSRN